MDNRINLSYASGVKIGENMTLKAGVGLNYNNLKIDAGKLILSETDDQAYMSLLNGNNSVNRFGLNIGVALSSDNYYLGYGVNDIVQHFGSENEYFEEVYVLQHIAQAGYRRALGESFGVIINGMYRYDENMKGVAEGQLKGVVNNSFWIGVGYRHDLAYTVNAGLRIKQFRLGYSREMSTKKNDGVYRGGNEIALSYNFTPLFSSSKKSLTIW
jgi:type IX secretion system PorP/SprF family membrane protein